MLCTTSSREFATVCSVGKMTYAQLCRRIYVRVSIRNSVPRASQTSPECWELPVEMEVRE
jgi:hypothetical protein